MHQTKLKKLRLNGNLNNVPEVIALRERLNNVCTDEDCDLSGGDAHAGWCEECTRSLNHARLECETARKAGWSYP